MRPQRAQQAVAGLIIVLIIAGTLVVGAVLALSEGPPGPTIAQRPTATIFRIPTLEPTVQRPTSTVVPVTIVPIPTSTPVTRTPMPTTTLLGSPATAVSTLASVSPSATICTPPTGWVPYTVQPGENLFRIGLRYGLSVAQMMAANCMSNERVSVGQVIYVPPVTPRATSVPTASPEDMPTQTEAPGPVTDPPPPRTPQIAPTGTQTATDGACTNPDSVITAPPVGAVLRGIVKFYGTATVPNFDFYKLEIRREGASEGYVTFFTGETEVFKGLLAEFDSTQWPNGEYWIRLVVVNSTGNYPERCAILYVVSN